MEASLFLKSIFIVFISLVFTACSSDSKDGDDSSKVYDLNVTPKPAFNLAGMSALKTKVFNQLINKEAIKFSDITKLLIEEQIRYYNVEDFKSTSVDTITNWIDDLTSSTRFISDVEDIKPVYQTKNLDMSEMKYNIVATSLPWILLDKKLQCHSSTILHQLVLRNNVNFSKMNPVVILESGHVLSGYISTSTNGIKLIGIENTVKGKGIKRYQDLSNYNGTNIRIVDSELFVLVEIFKNEIKNVNEVAKQVLDLTAKKYGFNASLNYEYSSLLDRDVPSSYKANESLLSFGNADLKEGDKDLSTVDDFGDDDGDGFDLITFDKESEYIRDLLDFNPHFSSVDSLELLDGIIHFGGYYEYQENDETKLKLTFTKDTITIDSSYSQVSARYKIIDVKLVNDLDIIISSQLIDASSLNGDEIKFDLNNLNYMSLYLIEPTNTYKNNELNIKIVNHFTLPDTNSFSKKDTFTLIYHEENFGNEDVNEDIIFEDNDKKSYQNFDEIF